jgi:nicotinamidase-related amidase
MADRLRQEIPIERTIHVCVDMQRLFGDDTPWRMAWMPRVLPVISNIVERHATRTIFTRFIPPKQAENMNGQWRAYYQRWPEMTRERLPFELIDLVEPLAKFVPPAMTFDKVVYSPFYNLQFHNILRLNRVSAIVVTGGETDVCVLATVLGAVDHGYRVILVRDALCSASDATHDAMMRIYEDRFSQQIEVCDSAELLEAWRP